MFLPLCRGISSKVKDVGDGSLSLVCLRRSGSQVTGNQRKGAPRAHPQQKSVLQTRRAVRRTRGGNQSQLALQKFPESALSSSVMTAAADIRRRANAQTAARSANAEERWRTDKREGRGTEEERSGEGAGTAMTCMNGKVSAGGGGGGEGGFAIHFEACSTSACLT